MKVAITHDYLNQFGGAERVLQAMHELWPEAPIFTSIYDKDNMSKWGFNDSGMDIRVSFMQKIPTQVLRAFPRYYFTFLYPLAFRLFDLRGYDVIISISSYAAKDIKKPARSVHIAYINTPPRFLYGYDQETNVANMSKLEHLLSKIWKVYLLKRDQKVAKTIDYFIANSKTVQDRIHKVYGQDSKIIYPPVDTERFKGKREDKGYFLIVSRLGEYKKVDLVVKAFNILNLPLKIVGIGPQYELLNKIAKPNVALLGRLADGEVRDLMLGAKAFVFPTEEDFGIAPVEAMAAGIPVIAYAKGGATETVIHKKTGYLFRDQTVDGIVDAVREFEKHTFSTEECQGRAKEFDENIFKSHLSSFVSKAVSDKISREG